MTSRWIYQGADPARLPELNVVLQPGDEFDAPDDWLPEPYPHPILKPTVSPPSNSAPAPAPVEE